MLTITGLSNAEYLVGSVALGIDEYYAGVGEAPGVWTGRWAAGLGLAGVVEADDLRNLVEGIDPRSGSSLVSGRPRSVKAWDLTFSAPKSVSVAWALGTDRTHTAVSRAHVEAVEVAVRFLEERAGVARHQEGGVRRRVPTDGWALAGFVHRTSREGDPQLHTHCLVPNLTRRTSDGRVVAIDAGPLHEWLRAAGTTYQNEVQRRLTASLGVEWGPDRSNTRDLAGLDLAGLRVFSKRTAKIDGELDAAGTRFEDAVLRMRADDHASLATRALKDHALTPARLADRWATEATAAGIPTGVDLDLAISDRTELGVRPSRDVLWAGLVDHDGGVCSNDPRFSEADVVAHLAAVSAGRLTLDDITTEAEAFLASDLTVRLTPDATDQAGRKPALWSTTAHRHLEDRVLGFLDHLQAAPGSPIPTAAVEGALAASPFLDPDQTVAVRLLCAGGASVAVMLAPAGYGKTAMIHAAASAATTAGRPVVGVATTSKAVAELDGAGIPAVTIARLRLDLRSTPLAPGTVVVLDEVSQTSTVDAETVLAAVAACPGGQVWILGDPRQGRSVLAGGLAAELHTRADAGQLPSAQLAVNRRQVDPVDRAALDLLRNGHTLESQTMRADSGWEHDAGSPEATRTAMAAAVAGDIARHDPAQIVALTVSHGDAEDLADRIRSHLTAAGALTGPGLTGPGWTTNRTYQAGDRILLHAR